MFVRQNAAFYTSFEFNFIGFSFDSAIFEFTIVKIATLANRRTWRSKTITFLRSHFPILNTDNDTWFTRCAIYGPVTQLGCKLNSKHRLEFKLRLRTSRLQTLPGELTRITAKYYYIRRRVTVLSRCRLAFEKLRDERGCLRCAHVKDQRDNDNKHKEIDKIFKFIHASVVTMVCYKPSVRYNILLCARAQFATWARG